jgi:hypothetical protein
MCSTCQGKENNHDSNVSNWGAFPRFPKSLLCYHDLLDLRIKLGDVARDLIRNLVNYAYNLIRVSEMGQVARLQLVRFHVPPSASHEVHIRHLEMKRRRNVLPGVDPRDRNLPPSRLGQRLPERLPVAGHHCGHVLRDLVVSCRALVLHTMAVGQQVGAVVSTRAQAVFGEIVGGFVSCALAELGDLVKDGNALRQAVSSHVDEAGDAAGQAPCGAGLNAAARIHVSR